jgi:hypothetical protein
VVLAEPPGPRAAVHPGNSQVSPYCCTCTAPKLLCSRRSNCR